MSNSIPAPLAMFKTAAEQFIKESKNTDASSVANSADALNKAFPDTELPDDTRKQLANLSDGREALENGLAFIANYNFDGAFESRINEDRNEKIRAIDIEAQQNLKKAAAHIPTIKKAQDRLRAIAGTLAAPVATNA
ncbi:MAG: hypothetical protein O3C63_06070 [Cyanobacteria bacterium]|nr:hypothetical protein [Cyanobacteriota bacterium]MDA1020801.1 hypothetical protein [Cyanobacteriota bacterium]